MKLLKANPFFSISLTLTLLAIIGFLMQIEEDFFPDSAIQIQGEIYGASFSKIAKTVEYDLLELKDDVDSIHFFQISKEQQLKLIVGHLNKNKNLKGFMLLDHTGRFSVVQRDKKTFVFAADSASKIENVTWYRVNNKLEKLNNWDMALGYELNILDKGGEAFQESLKTQKPQWSSTKNLFGNTEGDIAIHITWQNSDNKLTAIAMLGDIKMGQRERLFEMNTYQSFMVNSRGECIPLFVSDDALKDTLISKKPLYHTSVDSWKITGEKFPNTYSFKYGGSLWWGQSVLTQVDGVKGVVLNVSQKDLYYSSLADHIIEFSLVLILIGLSIFLFIRARNKSHMSLEDFVKNQANDKHASELIKEGESSHLEFKSSFHYDYHLKTVNKELEGVIAKSIAAFSNARGGTLLIGIDDDGNVLGLENDINTLKRKDVDFFENTLRMFLNKTFSVAFITQNVHIKFPIIDHKAICRIDIAPSNDPVFVEIAKNSRKAERFYLRSGNTSQEITSLSEINDYVKDRF
ncbi:MAG: hypothetical protein B7C24_01450 [Bacteroidetes bacterium 4572_77]|nr:MAG: hypothetical protein B7C24_01450 [Bacteroidetes bacterium 4572_77]